MCTPGKPLNMVLNLMLFRVFQNNPSPSKEDLIGAVSCIVWSLTLVPLIKYCFLVLRAGDDQGEGMIMLGCD